MGNGRGGGKWQGIAGIPLSFFSNCESDLQGTAVQGRKGFCFLSFFLKENVASASVLVVALVTHSLGSYSHAAAAAEVNLTPEKISCFFTKLSSRTKRKWEVEVGGLKRLSPPYGQLHKSTEGIVSRIIGWKKKRALFQDRRDRGKRQQKEEGEKKIESFPIRVVRVGKCRWREKKERKKNPLLLFP